MRTLSIPELSCAIGSNDIYPVYQPIVDLLTGQPKGFEVLARWNSLANGMVSPAEFIPFAQKVGLLTSLTESIFSQAAETAAHFTENLSLWLNVAPCQLSQTGFVERILEIAKKAKFSLENLVVEITENTCLLDEVKARRAADELRAWGAQLAIDDFGIGYSNFKRLRSLPFDIVKVDAFYIAAISKQDNLRCQVQSILNSALEMGLDTVAEGIEKEADAEVVRDLGCRNGQGWFFGRPERSPRIQFETLEIPSRSDHKHPRGDCFTNPECDPVQDSMAVMTEFVFADHRQSDSKTLHRDLNGLAARG
jgi:EAL domain-containing protein (putative c-di-GMP-specific phosphodiesterase class I)